MICLCRLPLLLERVKSLIKDKQLLEDKVTSIEGSETKNVAFDVSSDQLTTYNGVISAWTSSNEFDGSSQTI